MQEDALSYEKQKLYVVWENDSAFCMVNQEALNDGHLMVVPKRFARDVEELNEKESHDFLQLIGETRKQLDALFEDKAVVFINPIPARTQPRLHAHVLPFEFSLREVSRALLEWTREDIIRKKRSSEQQQAMAVALRNGKKP